MKKVLIIGVSGQDGSYLARYLLSKKKYTIYGIVRKKINKNKRNQKSQPIPSIKTKDAILKLLNSPNLCSK